MPTTACKFKPGTDVPLLNAMLHTIIKEGLTDQQYIEGYTEGFAELKARVQSFSPEAMAPVCGIDAARPSARSRGSMPSRAPRSSSGAWAFPSMSTARTMRAA